LDSFAATDGRGRHRSADQPARPAPPRRRSALLLTGGIVLVVISIMVFLLDAPNTPAEPPNAASATAVPVPESLRTVIADAAKSCPALTAARLAGQLMSASGFDEYATSAIPGGGSGIAGLTDDEWARWIPDPGAARGDNAANVVALAHEMCDFVSQVRAAGFSGDGWRLALASYRVGLAEVRAAGGVPSGAAAYVDQVVAYAQWYETQQLALPASTPPLVGPPSAATVAPSTSVRPSTTVSPSTRPSTRPTTPRPTPTPTPSPSPSPSWTTVVVPATTVLDKGQSIRSNRTLLTFDLNGNLNIFDEFNNLRWTSDTAQLGGYRAVFQSDGNLVVYDQDWQPLWTSGTAGHDDAVLVLEPDGNVCILYQSVVIWASETGH
jgi:hypothetical protein